MAKRKQSEPSEDVPMPQSPDSERANHSQVMDSTDSPANPLMDEIQTFMTLRDELARKLAAEIEATEQKLAELRETAASLFPQEVDDKKSKKAKPKPAKADKSVALDQESVAA